MGDEIAGRNRQQAGRGRRDADEARHEERGHNDRAEKARELERLDRHARRPEHLEPRLRLGQAVEQDRRGAGGHEDEVLDPPARQQQPGRKRSTRDPALGGVPDQGRRREPPEQPEPHAEGLPIGPPGVAPELGHHREGEGGVPYEHDEQGPRAPAVADELEPDEEQEPDDRRPAAQPARGVGDRPAAQAEPGGHAGSEIVDRRERVEDVPDRSDERGQERQTDPPVDPQEQSRHVSRAGSAGDALGDDPDPANQADGTEDEPQRGGHGAAEGRDRRFRSDVGDQEERERQPDRDRRSREIDDQRQAALIRVREAVGKDRCRACQQQDRDHRSDDQAPRPDSGAHVSDPPGSVHASATGRARP